MVGPVVAKETTDDGMAAEEEAMADGNTTDDGTSNGSDDAMTDDGVSTDDTMTEDEMTDDDTEGTSGETASGGQPGFGLAVGAVVLLAAAGYALYRRGG